MMNGTAFPPPQRPRTRPLQPLFHVLTDGSEHTGGGCLFLSIQPTPNSTIKYALTGLCEQVSRLAADQKYPLHHTRAVFCSSTTTSSLDGLASLLLTLQQAGAPQLVVCGGNTTASKVEGIVEIVLHKQTTHPQVQTCEMDGSSESELEWYRIYQDEYLVVHGKSVSVKQSNVLVLVYTLMTMDEGDKKTSFAIVPPGYSEDNVLPLPEYCGDELLDFCLCLNASEPRPSFDKTCRRVLRTRPSNNVIDDGLLIRAQYHANNRYKQCSFLYPYNGSDRTKDGSAATSEDESSSIVTTCTRWKLGEDSIDRESYKQEIWERCMQRDDEIDTDAETDMSISRHDFYSTSVPNADENEIDLDDETHQEPKDDAPPPSVPHLLVLGTGCATPSPLRGSSGYALFVPSSDEDSRSELHLKIVVECGEGFVTSLHRHLPVPGMDLEQQLATISLIWISHSHLDHYGGLPCLLREIDKSRDKTKKQSDKKRRLNPPLVIAPTKVLRYIATLLANDKNRVLFDGLSHSEWSRRQQQCVQLQGLFPFQTLQSIPVDHCPDAHGLLLEWTSDNNGDFIRFVYSGDCRPSHNLIRHVTSHQGQRSDGALTVLLHEATFTDSDAHLARSKRHSTVSEALWVASEIHANATLLTHFSSRNHVKSPKNNNDDNNKRRLNYGYCQDGLWISLTRKAMSNVNQLK